MKLLTFYIKAQGPHSLHSPFVYRLYTEVLFSKASHRGQRFCDICWRLEHYYGCTLVDGRMHTRDGLFWIVDRPHRNEQAWQAVIDSPEWHVTIDLWHCGIAVGGAERRQQKQHFLLR